MIDRSTRTLSFNTLKHSDITKRGGARIDVFLQKLADGESFSTIKGQAILDSSVLSEVQSRINSRGYKYTFDSDIGKVLYPNEFLKSPEFGGKGKGFGLDVENAELANLKKLIKSNGDTINLLVDDTIHEVYDIVSTPGVPKSDFHFIDKAGNELAWISHKGGSTPKCFQQYGGLSHNNFKGNSEIASFVNKLVDNYSGSMNRGDSAYSPCLDRDIINMSIWGIDHSTKQKGRNNVDEFHQGRIDIVPKEDYYELVSSHYMRQSSICYDMGNYSPIYYARYTNERDFRYDDLMMSNIRAGVFAIGQTGKNTIKLK